MNEESSSYSFEYPEPLIYEHWDGTVWERTGYCCQCGECCLGCPFTRQIDKYCIYLKQITSDRFICTGRHTDYHKVACSKWPVLPAQIKHLPKCTYKFKQIK